MLITGWRSTHSPGTTTTAEFRQEVIGDLQSAQKTYELTKMRYADDEEHM